MMVLMTQFYFYQLCFYFDFKIWILNYFIINQVVYKCQYIRSVENEQIKLTDLEGNILNQFFRK